MENPAPAPALAWTRSYCKKMYRPRASAKDDIRVCARNCSLSHKQAPSSNQNKASQVKVTEQRSLPLKSFLSCVRGRTFPRSPDTTQNPIDFSENERCIRLQDFTKDLATANLSTWHNCLWHLENNLKNVVRTPQLGCNNYFSKLIFILYEILQLSPCSYISNKFTFQLCLIMNCVFFNCLDFCITLSFSINAYNIP